jgi:hypothetical protein
MSSLIFACESLITSATAVAVWVGAGFPRFSSLGY